MKGKTVVPRELAKGVHALDWDSRFEAIGDWQRYEDTDSFGLRCRLTLNVPPSEYIPQTSNWYLLVSKRYPRGEIAFVPDNDGGIVHTFPHQNANIAYPQNKPWRRGKLCLETTVHALGRDRWDAEPFNPKERLAWHIRRALTWINLAATDELLKAGEPFELPQIPNFPNVSLTIAFNEAQEDFASWAEPQEQFGFVYLSALHFQNKIWAAQRFENNAGKCLREIRWGSAITEQSGSEIVGIWLITRHLPLIEPWSWPVTWDDLRKIFENNNFDFENFISSFSATLRDGKRHPLLLGFAISERVGDLPQRNHWQALLLPALTRDRNVPNGFRKKRKHGDKLLKNSPGFQEGDRRLFWKDRTIDWMHSENWSQDQLATRGRLPESITSKKVLIIGAGALGAPLAELLLRGGVHDLVIADGEVFSSGNLVRHVLGMESLGESKASNLAKRLRLLSPHAKVEEIVETFPPKNEKSIDLVNSCTVVIDCTAKDDTSYALHDFKWENEKTFLSLAVGFEAKRLYAYAANSFSFPVQDFTDRFAPWEAEEKEKLGEFDLPWEGIGCWHPVFPARADDMVLAAGIAVKCVVHAITSGKDRHFVVFEQDLDEGAFEGFKKLSEE